MISMIKHLMRHFPIITFFLLIGKSTTKACTKVIRKIFSHSYNFFISCFYRECRYLWFLIKPTNVIAELMLAERTKMLSQDRSKLPSVFALTDKMSRLTNRKAHNPKLLLNELTTGDRNVTFSANNNHSTTKATSSEGKKAFIRGKSSHTHSRIGHPNTLKNQAELIEICFQFNIGWFLSSPFSIFVFFVIEINKSFKLIVSYLF